MRSIFSSDLNHPDIQSNQAGARVRASGKPEYSQAFEAVWSVVDKRGSKNKASIAWRKRGSPSPDVVSTKRREYLTSLESWRNPQDIATWLNDFGHTQTYGPPPAEKKPIRPVEPIAVRMEREREERIAAEEEERIPWAR
jgi:hypothetical protein